MSTRHHNAATDPGLTVVVLVASGPEEGLRLRYLAIPGEDRVVVEDADADGAVVGSVTGIDGPERPRLKLSREYFGRLAYCKREVRDTAKRHAQRVARATWGRHVAAS